MDTKFVEKLDMLIQILYRLRRKLSPFIENPDWYKDGEVPQFIKQYHALTKKLYEFLETYEFTPITGLYESSKVSSLKKKAFDLQKSLEHICEDD